MANTSALMYEIVNASDATLVNDAEYWDTTANAGVGGYVNATATTTGTTTQYVSVVDTTQTIGKVNKLTINPTTTSTSTTFSVTVRSFSDLDSSGTVTSGDLTSDAVTITFHKSSDLTVTTTLAQPVAGVNPVATLSVAPAVFNVQMTDPANFNATFSVNGGATTSGNEALNADKDAILSTSGVAAAAGQVIAAQAQAKSYDASALADIGSSISLTTPAASTAAVVKATISNSANIKTGVVQPVDNTVEISKEVRSGTAAISYTVSFETATAALGAGVPVQIVATENVSDELVVGESITINGEKITGTVGTDSITINALTDANGEVTVSVTSANAKAGENLDIVATSNSISVGVYLEWVTAAIDDVYVTNDLLGDTDRTIVKGGSTSLDYFLVDQFKQAWTRTDYSYRLVFTNDGTATNPSPVVLSNGRATLVWTDSSTAASGLYTVTATLQDQTANGAWSSAITESVASNVNVVVTAPVATAIAAATAVGDTSGAVPGAGVPLALVDLGTLDNRVDSNTVASLGVAANDGAKLVATVTAANGGNAKGAAVTISAAGVYFATTVGGTGVVTKDSITVNSATNGQVTVFAYSNSAGLKTISYTAGSVSKTQDVTWAPALPATGTAVTIDAPASAQPGSTFMVTGTVADKYGNPVKVGSPATLAVSYAGPGLVSGILPTTTSADGTFTFYVLLGSNDSGSVTVTASYDADGAATAEDAVVATASITVGAVASATKVNAGSFKGYVALYAKGYEGQKMSAIVAGKWLVVSSLATDFERVVRYTGAGYDIVVTIYIDGVMMSTFNVTTK
jgi:hypothetical protein